MHWAANHDHIILTSDLDFGAILAATQERRPSVVQVRSDALATGVIGSAVLAALHQMREELSHGALISVDTARVRLRVLPLRG